jgi:hypothetical protein
MTFWQQMYFVCLTVGIALFTYFLINVIPQSKKDFKVWKRNYFQNEYPKVKAETDRIVRDLKQKIFGKRIQVFSITIMMITIGFISMNPSSENATATSTFSYFMEHLNFTIYPESPIIESNGGWEGTNNIADFCIIEEANHFSMYYTGNASGMANVGLMTSPKTDRPLVWTRYANNPIITGPDYTRLGNVIKVGNIYYAYTHEGFGNNITRYDSTDGINFGNSTVMMYPGEEETTNECPAVVRLDNGSYYMYYAYRTATFTFNYYKVAYSSNGVQWTKGTNVLQIFSGDWDTTYMEHHQILYLDGKFILVYEAYNSVNWGIGLAYSDDPMGTFTPYSGNPILTHNDIIGSFIQYHVATPYIFIYDGVLNLFFQGGDAESYSSAVWEGGLAACPYIAADNPIYNSVTIFLVLIATVSVGLIFVRSENDYTITGLLYLLIGIFVAGILLSLAIITFWA